MSVDMLRRETLRGFFLLLSASPITMANSFVESPGVVRGDVIGSAVLEWTLQSEPGSDGIVSFTFNSDDVFRYIPYTGVIPPRVVYGPDGNPQNTNASYDPRFSIYNSSTKGVGFRLAGLRLEDAGNYTCRYESLVQTVETSVMFVYDVPDRPVINASTQIFVEGVTTVSLECRASSTSLPGTYRPAMFYMWRRNGVDIDMTGPPERHDVLGDSGQILEISPIHHTDATYTCTASENGTQLTSEETELTLDVLHGPYSLKINQEKPSARENEALEIIASAVCNPACNYTWSTGDVIIRQGPILGVETFQSHDANNYTVRAANIYGTADFTVEVTLDTSPSKYTIPAENEFWTTDSGVESTRDTKRAPASNRGLIGGSFSGISIILPAAGGVVLIIIVIVVTVVCVRRKRKPASEYVNSEVLGEPGHPMGDYVNAEVFREPGHPTGDYMTTDVFREPGHPTDDYMTTDVFREPGHRADDYVNSEIFREPTSAGHQPIDASGQYERMDMTTREPRDQPADASGQYERIDMATREPADPTNRVCY